MLRQLFILFLIYSLVFQTKGQGVNQSYKDSVLKAPSVNYYVYAQIAQGYSKSRHIDSATFFYKMALGSLENQNNNFQEGNILSNLGGLYLKAGKPDSALFFFNIAKSKYLSIDSIVHVANCLINIGIINKDIGKYEKSLKILIEAANLLHNKNQYRSLSSCYNTIGTIYSKQSDWINANHYYRQSLKLREKIGYKKLMAASYNNLGITFRNLKIYDSAFIFYQRALKIKEEINDKIGTGATLNNMGMLLMDQEKYNEAESYLLQALQIRTENIDIAGRAITLNNLGLLYYYIKDPEKSLYTLTNAQQLIDSLKLLNELKDNLEIKLRIYDQLGLSKEALEASKRLIIVKDSLLNKGKAQALIEMQTKYETERKENEIQILEQKQNLDKAALELKNTWLTGFITISSLLLIIGVLAVTQWRKEKHNKQKIEILLQELHHRVKNNLQILSSIFSLQSRSVHEQSARDTVKSGENRVNAMAIIHQKLYKTNSRSVELNSYLIELVKQLAESYGYELDDGIIHLNIEHGEIDVDKIIPIGLIVNELVSNSFKYSISDNDDPYILVEARFSNKFLLIKTEDNGKGFDKEDALSDSMGLNIIETLGMQIGAKIQWNTSGKVLISMSIPL